MQLGSKENENERFAHYLSKTFKKTASLLANSCKAVSRTSVECHNIYNMSLVLRKPVFGFPTRSDTNRAVQPQKMARGLKFWI